METIIKLSKEEKKAIREKELAIKAEQEIIRQTKAFEHFVRISRMHVCSNNKRGY